MNGNSKKYFLLEISSFKESLVEPSVLVQFEGKNPMEVFKEFEIFKELGVDDKYFVYEKQGVISLSVGSNGERACFPLKNIIDFAKNLEGLKSSKNFNSLSEGIRNPQQFYSTIFEVYCATFLLRWLSPIDLEFNPEVNLTLGKKYPDFVLKLKNHIPIYCECKSLFHINRVKRSRINKIREKVIPKLREIANDKYRMEICFKILPPHWNRNFSDQLFGAFKALIEKQEFETIIQLKIDNKYETQLKLSRRSDPRVFNGIYNLGDAPESGDHNIIISEQPNLLKDIKEIIKDALTQLPNEEYSLILIEPFDKKAGIQAALEIFQNNQCEKLTGIIIITDSIEFVGNPKCDLDLNNFKRW